VSVGNALASAVSLVLPLSGIASVASQQRQEGVRTAATRVSASSLSRLSSGKRESIRLERDTFGRWLRHCLLCADPEYQTIAGNCHVPHSSRLYQITKPSPSQKIAFMESRLRHVRLRTGRRDGQPGACTQSIRSRHTCSDSFKDRLIRGNRETGGHRAPDYRR
jgi:hypothetical protein